MEKLRLNIPKFKVLCGNIFEICKTHRSEKVSGINFETKSALVTFVSYLNKYNVCYL